MSNVRIIQLTTGENLVATVTNETAKQITMSKALVLMPQQKPEGITFAFMPWPIFGDETTQKGNVVMDKAHIVVTYEPAAKLVTDYQTTTSGLITPPNASKLILG